MGSPSPSQSPSPEASPLRGGKGDGTGKKGAELEAPSAEAAAPESALPGGPPVPVGSGGEDAVSRNTATGFEGAAAGGASG